MVIPFDLTDAPSVFQALVNDVLCDILNRFLFVHLDTILIFAKEEEHEQHVQQVLQLLLENQLLKQRSVSFTSSQSHCVT